MLATILAAISVPHSTSAEEQGWLIVKLGYGLGRSANAEFEHEVRSRAISYSGTFLRNVAFGVKWKLPRGFSFAPRYKRESEEKPSGTEHENRFYLDGGWDHMFSDPWKLGLRARLARRLFDAPATKDRWRLRLRAQVSSKIEVAGRTLEPFAWSEVFGETDVDEFNRVRSSVGIAAPLGDRSKFSLGYLRQDTRGKDSIHALSTGLSFAF